LTAGGRIATIAGSVAVVDVVEALR